MSSKNTLKPLKNGETPTELLLVLAAKYIIELCQKELAELVQTDKGKVLAISEEFDKILEKELEKCVN